MKTHALLPALLLVFFVACERDNFDNSDKQIIEGDPEQIAHVPIFGRVTNFSDEPLSNAQINAYINGDLAASTTTDSDGQYSLDGTAFEGLEVLIEANENNHISRLLRIDNVSAAGESLDIQMLLAVDGLEFQRSLDNSFVKLSGIALMENGQGAVPYVIRVTSRNFVDIETYFSDFAYPDSTGYYEIMVPIEEELFLRVGAIPIICVEDIGSFRVNRNIPALNEDFEVTEINGLVVPDDLFVDINTCSDNVSLRVLAVNEEIRDTFGSGSLSVSGNGFQIFDFNRTQGFEVCEGDEVIIYAYDNVSNLRSSPLNIKDFQGATMNFSLDVCQEDETFFELNSSDDQISVDNVVVINSPLVGFVDILAGDRIITINYRPQSSTLNLFYNDRFGFLDYEILSEDAEFVEISYSGEIRDNNDENPLQVSGSFKALKLRQE